MIKYIFSFLILFTTTTFALPIQHVVNGDFETGDFTGWNINSVGNGNWHINDGSFPVNGFPPLAAINGQFDALTTQTGPGVNALYQDILLPNSLNNTILSWNQRLRSGAPFTNDAPKQEWRVLLETTSGSLIAELLKTLPADSTQQITPTAYSFDVSAILSNYANQVVRVKFIEEDNLSFFSAVIDDVSLISNADVREVPEPSTFWLLVSFLTGLLFIHIKRHKLIKARL